MGVEWSWLDGFGKVGYIRADKLKEILYGGLDLFDAFKAGTIETYGGLTVEWLAHGELGGYEVGELLVVEACYERAFGPALLQA